MIKTNTNLCIVFYAISILLFSFNAYSNDFKTISKSKPIYPKSAYVKRISGYAVVEFIINEKGKTEKHSLSSAKCFNLIDKNGNYFWYDFEKNEINPAYDCKYFDFKSVKASKQLVYENYLGKPIMHSYKYNFKHWSLIKVDSVVDLDTGDFILE